MLTIKQCCQILEKESDKKYNDEEVSMIREFLYKLAKLNVEHIKFQQKLRGGL